MGYLDKMHKRARNEKIIKEIMNSYEYKQAQKKDLEQAGMRAYCNFCLMACDFLELRHGYKKNGLNKFLAFALERMKYLSDENEKYYEEMNDYFKKTFDVDVLQEMGMRVVN